MKKFLLYEIVTATGGIVRSQGGITSFKGISTDSRKIKPGELFLAIKGEKFDGHAFIPKAIGSGATGIIYSKKENIKQTVLSSQCVIFIEVKDTLEALHNLAIFYRKKFPIPLIGITGSNGKTSVKEMVDFILRKKFKTIKNPGNFNNHIGLPLSLLPLEKKHQIAIMEMGMSRPGEIRELCKIAMPNAGIITNVGLAHAENFKSIKDIAKCKAELVYSLSPRGVAIVNGDDPNLVDAVKSYRGRKIYFGKEAENEIKAEGIENKGLGINFKLLIGGEKIGVHLHTIGEHNVYNALAASACSHYFGVSPEEIKKGLESYKGIHLRMELIKTKRGLNILNDTYNANPLSVSKALDAFAKIKVSGRKALLLGDMLELGKFAKASHRGIGSIVGKGPYDLLFTVGPLAKVIAIEAVKKGMSWDRVRSFTSSGRVLKILREELMPGDWLLVKGSRGMKLDEIVNEITK